MDVISENIDRFGFTMCDISSNEIVNFLIEFGRQSYYVLYRMKEGSSSREVIAKVPVDMPSYMHSFAMTEHYLILTGIKR